ncbi:MAG: glycoside hydrolase family 3 C-terminal domain-containing protein [Caldilineaceae bacterium]|nr:glycoside hydrolase family 3 C-terminal domain-containing protein [Caldilineaceae bacterium]
MTTNSDQRPWFDPNASTAERVEHLLNAMTLNEKIMQLGSAWIYEVLDSSQQLAQDKLQTLLANGLGQITRLAGATTLPPEEVAKLGNQIQRFLVGETRLGIPAMVHDECCSGMLAHGASNFPQIIGLAATWEPELAQAMTNVIRLQMRALGVHHGLAPVLDIARDPRWGRIEETFGEDPYLTARMGVAYVRGLQSEDWSQGVVATGKHFVGYSAPEGGLNWAPAHLGEREMREIYLAPFEAAVQEAGLASMMNAYQEIDGVPCAVSKRLLTDILRGEWGFDGVVVSDYFAINQVADYHQLARDKAEAARLTLEAGMDLELPSIDCFKQPLIDAVESGSLSMDIIDRSVRRVLAMKFAFGLFENPYVDPAGVAAVWDTADHRALARRIAQQSIVLLKNDDDLLPLSSGLRSVAVIGPNADSARNLMGDYSHPAHIETLGAISDEFIMDMTSSEVSDYDASHTVPIVTVLEGITQALAPGAEVRYAKGCDVLDSSTDGFAAAVEAAENAEIAVVVVGDKAGLTPDSSTGEFRDRATLGLPGVQQELVEAVLATGTPTVVVLVNGRPFSIPWIAEHAPALVEAWLPGEEGGHAVADVLFGRVNPGGKLPVTVVRSVGQTPLFYNHRPSGARSFAYGPYVDESNTPLFPFGHGLSYTSFVINDLAITPQSAAVADEVEISVVVTNTGQRAGDEVVQLYTRTDGATVTRPVKELRGFQRLTLEPGESRTVRFTLPVAQLAYYNAGMEYGVEAGDVTVMVGNSSQAIQQSGYFRITDPAGVISGPKTFFGRVEIQ